MDRNSRSSGKRRSSIGILKLGLNRDDETTGILFNKSQGQSRRVSFAATAEVKEFPRDSPRAWRNEEDEENEKENVPNQNKSGGVSITGLDSLIHGTIDPQSYQNIIECPIPEMSADSFNLCVGNETVREPRDMETTQCVEGAAQFDWPAFDSEPSAEIRITESSFLASLKRQNKSLSPMQIYRSPNEKSERPPSLIDFGQRFPNSGDSDPPIMMSLQFNEASPLYKPVDSKFFLSGLRGSGGGFSAGSNDMDETLMDRSVNMSLFEESEDPYSTGAVGNKTVLGEKTVLGDKTGGLDETDCIGGILSEEDEIGVMNRSSKTMDAKSFLSRFKGNQSVNMAVIAPQPVLGDRTVLGDTTGRLEETVCIGGIETCNGDSQAMMNRSRVTQSDRTVLGDAAGRLEETVCIGGIETFNNGDSKAMMNRSGFTQSDKTVNFKLTDDGFSGMDETQCHGAILNTSQMAGSASQGGKQAETTVTDGNKTVHGDGFEGIEETDCIGGILSNVDKENMVPSKGLQAAHLSFNTDRTRYFGDNGAGDVMEETRSVGAILNTEYLSQITANNTINNTLMNTREEDRTKYFGQNGMMEETASVGAILNSESSYVPANNTVTNLTNRTKYFMDQDNDMDETKCVDRDQTDKGLDKTIQQGVDKTLYFSENSQGNKVEETACIGGIVNNKATENTDNTGKLVQSTDEPTDRTKYFTENNESFVMDETLCEGGILTKTLYTEGDKEKSQRNNDRLSTEINRQSSESSGDRTKYFTDMTVNVEETNCIGGIVMDTKGTNFSKENQTDENKTRHFGKNSDQAGIEETQCIDATIHTSNSAVSSQGVGTDGKYATSSASSTSVLDHDINQSGHQLYKTTIGNISMDETNVGGGILSNELTMTEGSAAKQNNACQRKSTDGVKVTSTSESMDTLMTNEIALVTTSKLSVQNSEINNPAEDEKDNQVCPDITDTEITFKTNNKRTLSDLKSHDTEPPERTRDLTQTDSYTKKIKEMLMMSAQKMAPQIKAGMIKTPSKPESGITQGGQPAGVASQTSSPAHKRIRLFESQPSNTTEKIDDIGATPLDEMVETNAEFGIQDETMPDLDLISHIGGCDTRNESAFQQNTTRGTSDSGTSSNLSNSSMFSNRSMLLRAPDGPMTMDTFFKLTAKPPSSFKIRGRCSMHMPAKKIDCLDEILETEIVDKMVVEDKKKMFERVTDRLQKNKDNMDWLKKTIEETQPQIFEDVAKGNRDEVNAISEELLSMYNCCSKEGTILWIQERTKMYEETIEHLQSESVQKAEGLLETVRTQSKQTQDLLDNLDSELEELTKSQLMLEELEDKKKRLEKELTDVCERIETNITREKELKKKEEESQQNSRLHEIRGALRQQIKQQLVLVDWNLETYNEDSVGFTFLDGEFLMTVYWNELKIQGIEMESRLEAKCPWLHKRMAHSLLMKAIDKEHFVKKYTDRSTIPRMMNEISSIVSEIRQLCREVEEINENHKLTWDGQRLSIELWNIETLKMVKLSMNLPSQIPTMSSQIPTTSSQIPTSSSGTTAVNTGICVKRQLGNVSEEDIQTSLSAVTPGSKYLHRLINTVERGLSEIQIT